jgi:tetratricopeptide (TPR) repeat protein
MPCRYYFWTIILVFYSCASVFHRASDFERGLAFYNNKQYAEAAEYFNAHHSKHPESDSTLYFLFNCYKYLEKPEEQISTLEKLADRGVTDENVYLNLIYYYRKYRRLRDLYALLSNCPLPMTGNLDRSVALTREFLSDIICGATPQTVTTDPMIYSISKGYLPLFPDGKLYAEDTLTNANLVVLLDRLIKPYYPRTFYPMKSISTKSYLYLPYMRLVDSAIMKFDPYLVPEEAARVSIAVQAIEALAERGLFD